MNYDLLLTAPKDVRDHVIEEYEHEQYLHGVVEKAVEIAANAYACRLDRDELPGDPPSEDALPHEWVSYFVGEGTKVYYAELFNAPAAV